MMTPSQEEKCLKDISPIIKNRRANIAIDIEKEKLIQIEMNIVGMALPNVV